MASNLPSEQAFEADDELGCAQGSSGRFGADEVEAVQHDRSKAALEQVSRPASAGVDEVSVAPVSLADSAAKVVGALGSSACPGFRIR